MKVVLLAAGKSQRIFKKINKNKCLLKINKNTIIENSINLLGILENTSRNLYNIIEHTEIYDILERYRKFQKRI